MGNNIYRSQLLGAIEAFLEGTSASLEQAQHIIQQCSAVMHNKEKKLDLDQIIWGFFIRALADSVYYEDETFLRETREVLLGSSSHNITRAVFMDDYRIHFTSAETAWYEILLDMLDFIATIPFTKIHEATAYSWQKGEVWATMVRNFPEALQAEEIEKEYRRRETLIRTAVARNPSPENIGDETIYHLVLREVASLLTGLSVGRSAVYCGYPVLDSSYTGYGNAMVIAPGVYSYAMDMSGSIAWARHALDAIAGKGGLFLSCRLSKAATFDADVLFVSIH